MLIPPIAHAHKNKSALTLVDFNAETKHVEVSHRLVLHDAEALISDDTQANLLDDGTPQRRALETYLLRQFSLRCGPPAFTPDLQILGSELDSGYIWAYYESPVGSLGDTCIVNNTLFSGVWPEYSNIVNFRVSGQLYSLTFTAEKTRDIVSFD